MTPHTPSGQQAVEITDAMVEIALTEFAEGEVGANWVPAEREAMRRALAAALATPPAQSVPWQEQAAQQCEEWALLLSEKSAHAATAFERIQLAADAVKLRDHARAFRALARSEKEEETETLETLIDAAIGARTTPHRALARSEKGEGKVSNVTDEQRAKFEAWANAALLDMTVDCFSGMYRNPITRYCLEAWNAALAAQEGTGNG